MQQYYVYAYLDPRSDCITKACGYEFKQTPIYVGFSGNPERMLDHLRYALRGDEENNKLKLNVIKKILAEGLTPTIIRVADQLTRADAIKLEIRLISEIGTRETIIGVKQGPLTNLRAGGEGGIMSEQTKEKLRQASLITAPITNADPRVRELIRRTHLGKPKSPEHKAKLQAHLKAKTNTPEQRAAMSARAKGIKKNFSPEALAAIKAGAAFAAGRVWINKQGTSKRVSLQDLELQLANGWSRGRK